MSCEWEAFVDAVQSGTPPPVSVEDARAPLVIGLAAGRSLREGRPVRLDEAPVENEDLADRRERLCRL